MHWFKYVNCTKKFILKTNIPSRTKFNNKVKNTCCDSPPRPISSCHFNHEY